MCVEKSVWLVHASASEVAVFRNETFFSFLFASTIGRVSSQYCTLTNRRLAFDDLSNFSGHLEM
jgi:hypothetical protein